MAETKTFSEVYNKAVALLSIRLLTVGELSEKLRQRGFSSSLISQVLRKLEELDFLNDERYAQIYVENLKRYKNFGYFGIQARLLKKKIPSDIISKTLQDLFSVEEELLVARRFLKQLQKQKRTRYEQIVRSLASRGFRSEVVRQILRESQQK